MAFEMIDTNTKNEAAIAAISEANSAIAAARSEREAIASDAQALLERAMQSEPDDAPKLAAAAEEIRVRKLRVLLCELQIPSHKQTAQQAAKAAAALDETKYEDQLATYSAELDQACAVLGYREGSAERNRLFQNDSTLRSIKLAKTAAHTLANNFTVSSPMETAYVGALKTEIAAMLK